MKNYQHTFNDLKSKWSNEEIAQTKQYIIHLENIISDKDKTIKYLKERANMTHKVVFLNV